MIKIETNESKRQSNIDLDVKMVIDMCKQAASEGKSFCFVTIDRETQRDVRDVIESTTNIRVAISYSRYEPSRPIVEHFGDKTHIKFYW